MSGVVLEVTYHVRGEKPKLEPAILATRGWGVGGLLNATPHCLSGAQVSALVAQQMLAEGTKQQIFTECSHSMPEISSS